MTPGLPARPAWRRPAGEDHVAVGRRSNRIDVTGPAAEVVATYETGDRAGRPAHYRSAPAGAAPSAGRG